MASSSLIPGKITLHSTSKIPLSERFKMVQQTALIKKNIEPIVKPQRPTVKSLSQGSKKNRMLAAVFANKASVLAALKIKKKSIKQRLGVKPKPARIGAALAGRPFASTRKATKRNISERLQLAPNAGGNSRRPKLNRNNFVGTAKLIPKNVRRVRQGVSVSSALNVSNRRPTNNRFNSNNNSNLKKQNNQANRSKRAAAANVAPRRNQQRLNQHMKNRRLTTNNNFRGNQQRQPQGQRPFNRRNNQQGKQGKPGQGDRPGGGFKQEQRNRNGKRRFQNNRRPPPGRQNQRRKNPDKNSLDKDLEAYMAKTRTQLDADLDAYMSGT